MEEWRWTIGIFARIAELEMEGEERRREFRANREDGKLKDAERVKFEKENKALTVKLKDVEQLASGREDQLAQEQLATQKMLEEMEKIKQENEGLVKQLRSSDVYEYDIKSQKEFEDTFETIFPRLHKNKPRYIFRVKTKRGSVGEAVTKYWMREELRKMKQVGEETAYAREEIYLQRKMRHPNVVAFLGEIGTEHWMGFVLESLHSDLWKFIEGHRGAPESVWRRIIAQLTFAVEYLHGCGIIHRDIKPMNVFVSEDGGVAKLGDFGMALELGDERVKELLGTEGYISPEMFRGKLYGKWADVWAVGAVAGRCLFNQQPFAPYDPDRSLRKYKPGNEDAHMRSLEKGWKYVEKHRNWKGLSKGAQEFLRGCLEWTLGIGGMRGRWWGVHGCKVRGWVEGLVTVGVGVGLPVLGRSSRVRVGRGE
ncbi:Serine/threonine-protein kinase 36 [Rhizophlyctis rosea]|nr:Serine/threonine-protein kinase 36 [Rhizophlyctis rosea]